MTDFADKLAGLSPEKRELLKMMLKEKGMDGALHERIRPLAGSGTNSRSPSRSSACGSWTSWIPAARSTICPSPPG
jgi:hypothetical protein